MRMVIRSTGNVQVRKVYLTQFCDMKSIVALYCSSHSTRLDRWLSWWYPVYILLNLIHCFWTRTTQRVFPFNFYLCNCIYFHVQYPPCRKLWNCGKAPEFELWPALILKEESTKEEEEEEDREYLHVATLRKSLHRINDSTRGQRLQKHIVKEWKLIGRKACVESGSMPFSTSSNFSHFAFLVSLLNCLKF